MSSNSCRALLVTLGMLIAPIGAIAQTISTVTLSAPIGTPDGIAVGPDGNIYVADFGGGAGTRVLKVDRRGTVTTFAEGFAAPDGLAFDAAGDLYVSSFNGGTIHRVKRDGTKTVFASGLDHPAGLAFDRAGRLYVANFGNFNGTTVSRISRDGAVSTFATGFRAPLGLAFGPDGMLHVSGYASGIVHRVDSTGQLFDQFAVVAQQPVSQLQYLAFDSKGTLYAPSLGHNVVYSFRQDRRMGAIGSGIGGAADGPVATARLHAPNSIAVLPGDTLVVTEFTTGRMRLIATRDIRPDDSRERLPIIEARPARPGSIDGRLLADDSAVYVVTQVSDKADTLGTMTVTRRRSGDTVVVVQSWDTRPLTSRDTILMDVATLRPFSRAAGPAARRTRIRYLDDQLHAIVGPDSLGIHSNAGPRDAAVLDLVAAALTDGNEQVIPIFVPAQRGIIPVAMSRAPYVTIVYPSAIVTVVVDPDGRRVRSIEYDYGARRLLFQRR